MEYFIGQTSHIELKPKGLHESFPVAEESKETLKQDASSLGGGVG